MIGSNIAKHAKKNRIYAFTIDMLHCYDDFILQLDDKISESISDEQSSIGFRCCRNLQSINGRIFFHCNDHAFQRINKYINLLINNRNDSDNFDENVNSLNRKDLLWNFQGLSSFRSWGPKENWNPAKEFSFPKLNEALRAAKWEGNNSGIDMYLSSSQFTLPAGKYKISTSEIRKEIRKPLSDPDTA